MKPHETVCIVCGRAVDQRPGRGRPRLYHPDCGRFWKHLQAAESALVQIDEVRCYRDSPIRSTLIGMANLFPSHDERATNGRFARKGE